MEARRPRRPSGRWAVSGRASIVLAAEVAVMLAFPVLLMAPSGSASPAPSSGFSVSVTASPSSGSVPLTVTFSATVSSGAPVGVTWTFGDSQTWSGAGQSAMTISHRFVAVGSYSVTALVSESTGSASGGVQVNVINGPLVVLIAASPINGTVPFTVTYHAVVSGGTGTYTSFNWGFGDGGYGAGPVVQYTYRYAGHFTATLTVVDTSNDSASSSYGIVALPANPSAGPASTSPLVTPEVMATAGIIGVAGLTWGFYRVSRRRHARSDDFEAVAGGPLPPSVGGPAVPIAELPGPSDPTPMLTASESAAAPAASSAEVASPSLSSPPVVSRTSVVAPVTLTAITSTPADAGPSAHPSGDRSPGEEPRRWSREIVAYLGGLPTLGPDDIPTTDWTQKGMSERLGTGQNQVSNVLRRLVAAGVAIEELQHVQGQPRRLKVYRLSMRGEALAREIRRRRAGQNPNLLRRDW